MFVQEVERHCPLIGSNNLADVMVRGSSFVSCPALAPCCASGSFLRQGQRLDSASVDENISLLVIYGFMYVCTYVVGTHVRMYVCMCMYVCV